MPLPISSYPTFGERATVLGQNSRNDKYIQTEVLSVLIRVHPYPIMYFIFKSFANLKPVFICVHLCPK
jgi:hypothetical protein